MAVILVGSVECLTVEDVAALLEVSPHQVRLLVRSRKLIRRGDTSPALIDRASVERYRRERGYCNRYGVKGGAPAARRQGVLEVR